MRNFLKDLRRALGRNTPAFGGPAPKPEPLDLTQYQGQWVAVRDNKVIAASPSTGVILEMIVAGGLRECEIRYECRPEEVMRWSVQYASRPGYVYPNCSFMTRESAENWNNSFMGPNHERGEVFTRDGQHEPWYPAPVRLMPEQA